MRKLSWVWALLGTVAIQSCVGDDADPPDGDAGETAGGASGGSVDGPAGGPNAGQGPSGGGQRGENGGAAPNMAGGAGQPDTSAGGNTPEGGAGAAAGASTSTGGVAGGGGVDFGGGAGGPDFGGGAGGAGGTETSGLAWPLIPTDLPSACSPTCATGTCHEECEDGTYPCDSGCCASDITSAEAPSGDNYVNKTALWVDASDHAHLGYTASYPFYARSTDQSWTTGTIVDALLPMAEDENGPLFDSLGKPYLAVNTSGVVYAAYRMWDSFSNSEHDWLSVRVSGMPFSHEDLPSAPRGLTLVDDGNPAVLLDHQILERTGPSTFDVITPPTSGALVDFAFAEHHYFVLAVASGQLELHYRNALGAWGSENVPLGAGATAGSPSLVVKNGMAYVSYGQNAQYVARRGATGWDTWPVPMPTPLVMESAFTVDDCGAPHFLIWETTAGPAGWDDRYIRWTTSGWRSFHYDAGCYFGDGVSIALTDARAILASASCTATIVTVPLAP